MSYAQLAEHAATIEMTAVKQDLAQRSFVEQDGLYYAPFGMDQVMVPVVVENTQAMFAGVSDMFTPFLTMPDPAGFDPAIQALTDACTALNQGTVPEKVNTVGVQVSTELGGMDRVAGLIEDWRGPAATNFRNNYLDRFKGVTANQFTMALALKGAMEAERAVWREARKSVDELAHAAQASLDSMLECDPKQVAFALTVAGSIFAIAAAAPTLGASLAVTLTVVGEVAATSGAIPMDDKPPAAFTGRNAAEICEQIQKGLDQLARDINGEESKIARSMLESHAVLDGSRPNFEHKRPALADATRATVTGNGPTGLGSAEG